MSEDDSVYHCFISFSSKRSLFETKQLHVQSCIAAADIIIIFWFFWCVIIFVRLLFADSPLSLLRSAASKRALLNQLILSQSTAALALFVI